MTIQTNIQPSTVRYAPDFELRGIDTQVHHLARYLEKYRAVGVVFMSNDCTYVQSYIERLKTIQAELQAQGFTLIGINANQNLDDSFEQMKNFADRYGFNFPYLWDSTRDVTESFGAKTTPMAFLIDTEGCIRYQGAIDDNATEPAAVKQHYLHNAVLELLQGQPISISATEAIGCALSWGN
jgi:peroxiredoxin